MVTASASVRPIVRPVNIFEASPSPPPGVVVSTTTTTSSSSSSPSSTSSDGSAGAGASADNVVVVDPDTFEILSPAAMPKGSERDGHEHDRRRRDLLKVNVKKSGDTWPRGEPFATEVVGKVRNLVYKGTPLYMQLRQNTDKDIWFEKKLVSSEEPDMMTDRLDRALSGLARRIKAVSFSGDGSIDARLAVVNAYKTPTASTPKDTSQLKYEGRWARVSIIRRVNGKYDSSYQRSLNAAKLVAQEAWSAGVDWLRLLETSQGRYIVEVAVVHSQCGGHLDLAFLIDGSGSLATGTGDGTPELFQKELDFVRDMAGFFKVAPDATRLSLVSFSGPRASHLSYSKNQPDCPVGTVAGLPGGTDEGKCICTSGAKCEGQQCVGDALYEYSVGACKSVQDIQDLSQVTLPKDCDWPRAFFPVSCKTCKCDKLGTVFTRADSYDIYTTFDVTRDKASFQQVLDAVKFPNGASHISTGLEELDNTVFRLTKGMRPYDEGIPRAVITLTDGKSNPGFEPAAAAKALMDKGIEMFSIGVGGYLKSEVLDMASVPKDRHMFELEDPNALKKIAGHLAYDICQITAPIPTNKRVRIGVDGGESRFVHAVCDGGNKKLTRRIIATSTDEAGATRLHASNSDINPSALSNDESADDTQKSKELLVDRLQDNNVLGDANIAVEGKPGSNSNLASLELFQAPFEDFLRIVSLKEDSDLGTTIPAPALATVKDYSPSYTYRLEEQESDKGVFTLDEKTGVLSLAADLDRETKSSYTVKIWATDSKLECLSGYQRTQVSVADVSDTNPVFTKSLWQVDWAEDGEVGDAVVTITATDADVGDVLNYIIEDGNELGLFSISGASGVISQARAIDYESLSNHEIQLKVVVEDNFGGVSEPATVIITVTDADETPVFDPNSDNEFDLSSTSPVGEVLGSVPVSDDGSENAFACRVADDSPAVAKEYFDVSAVAGGCGLSLKKVPTPLDGLPATEFNIELTPADGKDDTVFWDKTGVIVLVDGDNVPPEWLPFERALEVPCRSAAGTVVVNAAASDADGDSLSCQLSAATTDSGDAAFFEVRESATGGCEIVLSKTLPSQDTPFDLSLRASDSKSAPLLARISVNSVKQCPKGSSTCNRLDPCGEECSLKIACQGGGLCRRIDGGLVPSRYVCDCPPGRSGELCELSSEVCEGKCQNGGVCAATADGGRCNCPKFGLFYGKFCEILPTDPDPCGRITCPAGRNCVPKPLYEFGPKTTYTCECAGSACNDSTECDAKDACAPGAECLVQLLGTKKCSCPAGCSGEKCDSCRGKCDPDTTCPASDSTTPCAGFCLAEGMCTTSGSGGECMCVYPNYGPKCEEEDPKSDQCAGINCPAETICEPAQSVVSGRWDTYMCKPRDGKTPPSPCDANPCAKDSTCLPQASNTYTCRCPTGCSGEKCDSCSWACDPKNTCDRSGSGSVSCAGDCALGGTCKASADGGQCECKADTKGEFCRLPDMSIDACSSSPCLNGGSCTPARSSPFGDMDTFTCACPREYCGPRCASDCTGACASRPCQNGGVCTLDSSDESDGYRCTCAADTFKGTNCELSTVACEGQCQNGAVCIADESGGHCLCVPPASDAGGCFTGDRCETPTTASCAQSRERCGSGGDRECYNSDLCSDSANGGLCVCPPDDKDVCYTGETCQPETASYCATQSGNDPGETTTEKDAGVGVIIGGAVAGILLLALLILAVLHYRRKRSNKTTAQNLFGESSQGGTSVFDNPTFVNQHAANKLANGTGAPVYDRVDGDVPIGADGLANPMYGMGMAPPGSAAAAGPLYGDANAYGDATVHSGALTVVRGHAQPAGGSVYGDDPAYSAATTPYGAGADGLANPMYGMGMAPPPGTAPDSTYASAQYGDATPANDIGVYGDSAIYHEASNPSDVDGLANPMYNVGVPQGVAGGNAGDGTYASATYGDAAAPMAAHESGYLDVKR